MMIPVVRASMLNRRTMKKLITLMLGMTIVLGSTALFADQAPPSEADRESARPRDKTRKTKTKSTKTKKTKAANKS